MFREGGLRFLREDFLDEPRGFRVVPLSVFSASPAPGDVEDIHRSGDGDVEEPPFLLFVEFDAVIHEQGEEGLFGASDEYDGEFQTFRAV